MNIIFVKILIFELLSVFIIITPIVYINRKVKRVTSSIKEINRDLRRLIKTSREILKLSSEYIEILHDKFRDKLYSIFVAIGEITSYGIIRRMFAKSYQNFIIGFNIARLFW